MQESRASPGPLERIVSTKIIAVIRTSNPTNVVEACAALAEGGIGAVEITLTIPGALGLIDRIVRRLEPDLLVGAGTVLDAVSAARAVDAGARFVVSPVLDSNLMATCTAQGVLAVPGAMTPNEVAAALGAGAAIVKLLPARLASPEYVRDLLGPFPTARLMPTGSLDLASAARYFEAGVCSLGVGKALLEPGALARKDYAAITSAARAFSNLVPRPRNR